MSTRRFTLRTAAPTLFALCACLLPSASAQAANLEPAGINLGGTSFMDGFGRNEGGFTYLAYLQYGMGREIHGSLQANGDPSAPLPVFNDPHVDAFVLLNQLVYVVPDGLFGDSAHFGFDFILPLIAFNTSFAGPPPYPGTKLTDNGVGLGDLTFGPMLQLKPIIAGGRPVFSQRFEVDFVVPTGAYDPSKDINQSSNFVSFVPYWAGTVLPFPHLEISARLHYLYNFKNFRPALGRLYGNQIPPAVKSAQAGQAGWANFATSYEIFKDFRLGANGYYFQQFNLDLWEMLDGTSNPGLSFNDTGKLRVFAIGPGVMWGPGEHDKLFANLYFQLLVENGLQSNVINLRWVHGFP
jgi:hypothetical protein